MNSVLQRYWSAGCQITFDSFCFCRSSTSFRDLEKKIFEAKYFWPATTFEPKDKIFSGLFKTFWFEKFESLIMLKKVSYLLPLSINGVSQFTKLEFWPVTVESSTNQTRVWIWWFLNSNADGMSEHLRKKGFQVGFFLFCPLSNEIKAVV